MRRLFIVGSVLCQDKEADMAEVADDTRKRCKMRQSMEKRIRKRKIEKKRNWFIGIPGNVVRHRKWRAG